MMSPVWHPFTQHGLREPIPDIAYADGAAIYTVDDKRIVDAISSWWVITHGHRHPRITQAIIEQTNRLDQVIFAGFTHEPAERLASALSELLPDPLHYVFFSDSGSTSVEVALKMALGFWRNRNQPRHRVIVMEGSYHGDTVGAMSVGTRGVFNRAYQPLLFDVATVPFPARGVEQQALDVLERLCCNDSGPAAFIVEPLVLGAGGMRFYDPSVLRAMREICGHFGVLFIADEVMTGWGRTGTLLACDQAGIVPDLLCLAKGLTGGSLPLAVTVATPAIFDAHYSTDRSEQLFHSSSYTANPIACAAANANVALWQDEPVREHIAQLVERQAARLTKLKKANSVRQLGTITVCELDGGRHDYLSPATTRLMAHFRDRNVLLRPLGNTIYVMPPFCADDHDLDLVYDAIEEVL